LITENSTFNNNNTYNNQHRVRYHLQSAEIDIKSKMKKNCSKWQAEKKSSNFSTQWATTKARATCEVTNHGAEAF